MLRLRIARSFGRSSLGVLALFGAMLVAASAYAQSSQAGSGASAQPAPAGKAGDAGVQTPGSEPVAPPEKPAAPEKPIARAHTAQPSANAVPIPPRAHAAQPSANAISIPPHAQSAQLLAPPKPAATPAQSAQPLDPAKPAQVVAPPNGHAAAAPVTATPSPPSATTTPTPPDPTKGTTAPADAAVAPDELAPPSADAGAPALEIESQPLAADADAESLVPIEDESANTEPLIKPDAVASAPIRYVLEGVRVRGNKTRADVIAHYVPIKAGEQFDVDDPSIELIRWRLLGTGWFEDVKLSLARGSRRGWVVLVIDVRERNTVVIDRLVLGLSSVVENSRTNSDVVRPYAGLGIAENNLFGLGIGVRGAGVMSLHKDGIAQYGLDFGYYDPMLRGSGYSLNARVFHNYAREFFGRNPLVAISCPEPSLEGEDDCDPDVQSKRAVVIYHRTGIGIGTGHDISGQLRYTLDWLGELVDVTDKPALASTQRGRDIVPIDFRIEDGVSFVSSLRLGFIYDRRDHPALTTQGTIANFSARLASALIGSSYDFARFEGAVRHWFPLPWNHVISLGLFVGTVFGNAPFFYDFYAADLSDLLPSRVLELNLDRRRTLNLLGTSIVEMDMEDLAARVDFEYQWPVYRGPGVIHGVDAYAGAGIFMLASRRDLRVSISGYEGLSRLPVDLTFDLGLQADTELGVFRLGFSSLIGFSNLGQENP